MERRFLNRERELAALDRLFHTAGAQLLVVYGRRRVGKTALLREFLKEIPHMYHLCARLPEPEQLVRLGEVVGRFAGDPLLEENGFREWRQVFDYLGRLKERFALVVDEYPYLVEANPAMGSLWQKGWDEQLQASGIFLVLMGSSVAMMEQETLAARAPLYGRRTGQLRLEPLPFRQARGFFPSYDFPDQLRAYAMLGGIPYYLERFEDGLPLRENLRRHILDISAVLREEAEILLREELQQPRIYFSILNAVAQGKRKLGEIANATSLPHGTLTKYLSILQQLHLVQRETPTLESAPDKSKRGRYRIEDPYVHFWFRFVFRHRDRLEQGEEDWVADRIMESLDHHAAGYYETVCAQAVREGLLDGRFPERYRTGGRWWHRNEEIDLVALDEDGGAVLFGECKWSARPVGRNVLEELTAKSGLVQVPGPRQRERRYVLFSRSGFTDGLRRIAAGRRDVALVAGLDPAAT